MNTTFAKWSLKTQMSIKYFKWPLNISTSSYLRPSKIDPNWDFLFENKPSGNPEQSAFIGIKLKP
jgi:hypothetical protein